MALMWLIFGVSLTVVIYSVYNLARESEKKISWWQWVLITLWGIFLLVSVGFVTTSYGEGFEQAALRGGGIFLILVVVSGLILWRLIFSGKGSSVKSDRFEQME